jgi:hypothetical protein
MRVRVDVIASLGEWNFWTLSKPKFKKSVLAAIFFFYRFLCHCREHLKKFLNNSSEFLIMPDYMISKGIRGSTQTEQKCPFVFGWSELG